MTAYESLLRRAEEVAAFASASSLLQWDQEIHMPPEGTAHRAGQLAALGGHAHRLWTDSEVGRWLEESAASSDNPESDSAVNTERWLYDYDRARKIPTALVETAARIESEAHEAWKKARAQSDFSLFAPLLEKLVDIARQKADLWGYAEHPYDALLETYEPGLTTAQARGLFNQVHPPLSSLFQRAVAQPAPPPLPSGPYPIADQMAFNRRVVEAIGFDLQRGRIDTSVHPFSSSMGPHDQRITTRYDEGDFTSSFFGLLHECGHGLYEQGLPHEAYGTPLGTSVSLGIHESQSRFWENQIGRSSAFWEYWFPIAAGYFPQLRAVSADDVVAHVNRVARSFIRVDASEIGYDLHVILRFEVEEKIFSGALAVRDVPAYWNERFRELIGLDVPDEARGCLQDIHWSMGGFGYFPTYTLGSLNAAQLAAAADAHVGGIASLLRTGEYAPILKFLRENIHRHGRRFSPADLIQRATGSAPAPQCFLDYAKAKCQQG